jgi:predicted Zn-dependent protease
MVWRGKGEVLKHGGMPVLGFSFEVDDVENEKRVIGPHFVSIFVVSNAQRQPALSVTVPDIDYTLAESEPFSPADQQAFAKAHGMLNTSICVLRSQSGTLALTKWATDVSLDFSGALARATELANAGDHNAAVQILEPMSKTEFPSTGVFYQLTRSLRALNRIGPEQALAMLDQEIERASGMQGPTVRASYAMNTQGVILKGLDRTQDSMAAFTRALQLRPNYFEALLSYGTMLIGIGADVANVGAALFARAYAIQPKSPAFAKLIPQLAEKYGTTPTALFAQVQAMASSVNLAAPVFPGS